jgi:hypothetical protein
MITAGCAYAEVRPAKDATEEGIRFYRPWPYVWINLAAGGCVMTVQWFPDMTKEYIIIPHTGMGSLQVNPTLAEGWNLTAMNVVADSKVSEMVAAIAGMTGTIAGAAIRPALAGGTLGPGLYRLEFQNGKFSGLAEVFHLEENGQPLSCKRTPQAQGQP